MSILVDMNHPVDIPASGWLTVLKQRVVPQDIAACSTVFHPCPADNRAETYGFMANPVANAEPVATSILAAVQHLFDGAYFIYHVQIAVTSRSITSARSLCLRLTLPSGQMPA
jgi:hypothetical protein